MIAVELHGQRGVIGGFEDFLHLRDVVNQEVRHVVAIDGLQRGGHADALQRVGGMAHIGG